jgi:hypothetical protein
MTEQYQVAAWRHHETAEALQGRGFLDDAGYHYGVSGENSVKYALQASGVEAGWLHVNVNLLGTPMRAHFPKIQTLCDQAKAHIAMYATGRLAGAISNKISDISFSGKFVGWNINIRYADTDFTPVDPAVCSGWESDSLDLLLNLVV